MILTTLSTSAISAILAACWASYIEPNQVHISHINWNLPKEYAHLHGLRFVQISDLHMSGLIPNTFLDKVSSTIASLSPSVILFSGDFICRGRVDHAERLKKFLCYLDAPLGVYAILGNHDYATYVSRDIRGQIGIIPKEKNAPIRRAIVSVIQSLFFPREYEFVEGFEPQSPNEALVTLLQDTPVRLLHNETHVIPNLLNIVGLGDVFARQFCPEKAFSQYNSSLPGLILSHNPDSAKHLTSYPGDVILSGHSHGPQISLPWPKWARNLTNKLGGLEDPHLVRGLFTLPGDKLLYVNRGLGGLKRVRFFSPPEVCCIHCVYET